MLGKLSMNYVLTPLYDILILTFRGWLRRKYVCYCGKEAYGRKWGRKLRSHPWRQERKVVDLVGSLPEACPCDRMASWHHGVLTLPQHHQTWTLSIYYVQSSNHKKDLTFCVCACKLKHACTICMLLSVHSSQESGQLTGAGSFFLLCEFQGLHSGHQAWWQTYWPTKSSFLSYSPIQ